MVFAVDPTAERRRAMAIRAIDAKLAELNRQAALQQSGAAAAQAAGVSGSTHHTAGNTTTTTTTTGATSAAPAGETNGSVSVPIPAASN